MINEQFYKEKAEEKKEKITENRIKNKNYIKFLKEGVIDFLTEDDLITALNNITSFKSEARALNIILYYTGARPTEVLNLTAQDILKDGRYIIVQFKGGVKNTLPRKIRLLYNKPLVKEIYMYSTTLPSFAYMFYHFRSEYTRESISKKGIVKTYSEPSAKLRYYFKKWYRNCRIGETVPYFLRHNRFSKLAEAGFSDRELRFYKGSKTNASIEPYIHMSSSSSKKLAKKID
jgi:integrase